MHSKIVNILTVSFTLFILWIIYTADTGGTIVFTKMVRFLPYPDKWGHFFLFGILTLLINRSLKNKRLSIGKYKPFLGTILVSMFVIVEELSQGFLATRNMDYLDLVADGFGIAGFTCIAMIWKRKEL